MLKKLGNVIIIYTARRMKTHNGNVGKIIADIGEITLNSLKKFEIPYDEIHFGKPYANFYVDDLAINANSTLDKFTGIYDIDIEPRYFNKIKYENDVVIKETNNIGEIYWYQNIPKSIENLFPKLINVEDNKLTLERIDGVNMSYLFVNKQLKSKDITNILNILHLIHSIPNYDDINVNIYSNYADKLKERYYANKTLYDTYDDTFNIFSDIYNSLLRYEEQKNGKIGIIHGDPVLTNIIITKSGLKFIDMRGKQGDICTLFGDIFYDLAKIYQSLLGYDFILNDVEIDYDYTSKLLNEFTIYFTTEELKVIKLITSSLFFTLLPLHEENRDKFEKYLKIVKTLYNDIITI
jgi:hypothetical protein